MFDLHVPAEVSLQVELTGAVRTLEGLAASVEMHVAQQVVHSVKRLATYLEKQTCTERLTWMDMCQSSCPDVVTDNRNIPSDRQRLASHLAFERLHGQVDNHVRLEGLFLDEALEADVTLEGSDAVVDEHVSLQVGRQGELPGAHVTLMAFHPLRSPNTAKLFKYRNVFFVGLPIFFLPAFID